MVKVAGKSLTQITQMTGILRKEIKQSSMIQREFLSLLLF